MQFLVGNGKIESAPKKEIGEYRIRVLARFSSERVQHQQKLGYLIINLFPLVFRQVRGASPIGACGIPEGDHRFDAQWRKWVGQLPLVDAHAPLELVNQVIPLFRKDAGRDVQQRTRDQ